MFVVGLVVGPLIGLALMTAARRALGAPAWQPLLLGLVLVVVILFVPFLSIEGRIGLSGGLLLGLLLAMTPTRVVPLSESEQDL